MTHLALLNGVITEGLMEEVTFEQRIKRTVGDSHVNIWNGPGRANSKCTSPETGEYLLYGCFSFTVLQVTSLKSNCAQGHTPSKVSR